MRNFVRIISLLAIVALLAGCGLFPGEEAGQNGDETSGEEPMDAAPTTEAGPEQATEDAGSAEASIDEEVVVLTVWTAEAHAPSSETPGGQVLLEQLTAFDDANPLIRVDVQVKAAAGPGSTLAYLRSAPTVAPAILPDLVLLDRDTLIQAAHEGLITPVGDLIDPALLEELYPAAYDLGVVDDTLYGVAYAVETQHIVYRETLFQTPPNSFEAILESPVAYVFPAGTLGNVNRTSLAQYMAAGGTLQDADGAPFIDVGALNDVLAFYADAHEIGVIDPALFQLTKPLDSWDMYVGRQSGLSAVTSTQYLAEQDSVRSTGLTWVPTPEGDPFALASGWMWAITTQDPDRQAAAAALLHDLMASTNQGNYTQAAGWLPTQSSAFAVWGDDNAYADFGDRLLAAAVAIPDPDLRSIAGVAIQEAVENVLLNNVSPLQAASVAAQRVNSADTDS